MRRKKSGGPGPFFVLTAATVVCVVALAAALRLMFPF